MKTQIKVGTQVTVQTEESKVAGEVIKCKGIFYVIETEDGEEILAHRTKVTRVRKTTCKRLNFESRSAKLSDEAVASIRELWGTMTRKAIAEMFGISQSYAYKLATGRAAHAVREGLAS